MVGYGTQFDDDDFFRDAGQVGYNLTLGEHVRTTSTSATSGTSIRRTWCAAPTAGASITVPGGRVELQRHADLLHGRVPAAVAGHVAGDPLGVQSQSIEINDTIRWGT